MRAYNSHGRPPATPPRTMLKIVLYAAMEHNYSSRKIKRSCERVMNYIWLLNGAPAPSHFETARFRSKRLAECADELFSQLVHHLHELGEITFEHLFVDGTRTTPIFQRKKRYISHKTRCIFCCGMLHYN
ncbi:MAG: transposase [Candidatus Limivicinus sp.]|nr:transposase [Candidatus Limivicinus sp.]